MCKLNPPAEPRNPGTHPGLVPDYEKQYILAGPIFLQNYTTQPPTDPTRGNKTGPCNDIINTPPRGIVSLY